MLFAMEPRFAWRSDAVHHVLRENGVPDDVARKVSIELGSEMGWNVKVGASIETPLGTFAVPDEDVKLGPVWAAVITPASVAALALKIPVLGVAGGMLSAAVAAGELLYRAHQAGALLTVDETRVLTALEHARRHDIAKAASQELVVWLRTLFGLVVDVDAVHAVLDGLLKRPCNDGRVRAFVERHERAGEPTRWSSRV